MSFSRPSNFETKQKLLTNIVAHIGYAKQLSKAYNIKNEFNQAPVNYNINKTICGLLFSLGYQIF